MPPPQMGDLTVVVSRSSWGEGGNVILWDVPGGSGRISMGFKILLKSFPCRTEVTVHRGKVSHCPASFAFPACDTFEQGKLATSIKQASQTSPRNITLSLFPPFSFKKKKSTVVIATDFGCCIAASKDIERNPKKQ